MATFRKLHDNLLKSTDTEEEKVEVNQRHLIDKILARYSAEFTVFRELIQNANDADAKSVQIEFINSRQQQQQEGDDTTSKAMPVECDTIIVRNNGRKFTKDDWNRLRKIAEGNPDVDKIGFFGVGFFSLFSICEEPLVDSGGECMGFFWKGDQLFTKKGKSQSGSEEWTSFYLSLRDPMPIPDAQEFSKFLAMSLVFTVNLSQLRATANGALIVEIEKRSSDGRSLDVLNRLPFVKTSPNKIFELKSATLSNFELRIKKLVTNVSITKAFWSMIRGTQSSKQEYEEFSVFMRHAVATVSVNLPKNYLKDMERATKKLPPQQTKIHIIFTGHEDHEMTKELCRKNPAFRDLAPFPDQGRIYIGFPTHQTTGASIHLQAHLIPTVERESIDFNDRTLNVWNSELLTIGGLLCRSVYEDEFWKVSEMTQSSGKNETIPLSAMVVKMSTHMMNVFSFKHSTPNNVVSRLIHDSFHNCLPTAVSFLSSHGVKPATKVRLPDASVAKFSRRIAVVPEDILKGCEFFISELQKSGIILPITVADVLEELNDRLLTEDETISLIRWWIDMKRSRNPVNEQHMRDFMSVALIPGVGVDKVPVPLGKIRCFASVSMIPPSVPVPLNCMPSNISRHFSEQDLSEFLSLVKLDLISWAEYVCNLEAFESVPPFSEAVLEVLARGYNQLPAKGKPFLVSLLQERKCITTNSQQQVLRKPGESYFKSVTLFDDLPIVDFKTRNISESFLREIGVRSHVELQLVFDRLDNLNWDAYQLIKYLASVNEKLSEVEVHRLRKTPLFQAEIIDEQLSKQGEHERKVSFSDGVEKTDMRYRADELYVPSKDVRELKLTPIKWPQGKWRNGSAEAKFLERIGLKQVIPIKEIIDICADSNDSQRSEKALLYFANNFDQYYLSHYHPAKVVTPFIPCEGATEKARPDECFRDRTCVVMGFKAIRNDLLPHADKFGVMQSPSPSKILDKLFANPPVPENAVKIFSYLASQSAEFTQREWSQLEVSSFIPVRKPINGRPEVVWFPPDKVYFKTEERIYDGVFEYVDFEAGNAFLRSCGVKNEPSAVKLCAELLSDPFRFLGSLGLDKYLGILRQFALNHDSIIRQDPSLKNLLLKIPFVVGFTSGEDGSVRHQLYRAGDTVIVDDTVLKRMFNPPSAPMESLLEEYYHLLGAQRISRVVEVNYGLVGQPWETQASKALQETIRQRAPLLFHEPGLNRTLGKDKPKFQKLSNIVAKQVDDISMKLSWNRQTKDKNTTAALIQVHKEDLTLYIKPKFDYFDVAQTIAKNFFPESRLNDSLLISTLLSTPLESLRERGFPVDRLINVQSTPLSPKTTSTANKELKSMFPHLGDDVIAEALKRTNDNANDASLLLLEHSPPKLPERKEKPAIEHTVVEEPPKIEGNSSSRSSLNEQLQPERKRSSIFDRLLNKRKENSTETSIEPQPSQSDISKALESNIKQCGPSNIERIISNSFKVKNDDVMANCFTIHPKQDLKKLLSISVANKTIPFYCSPNMTMEMLAPWIYTRADVYRPSLIGFVSTLLHLAQLFGVSENSIHLYYPAKDETIAFFSNGSLFFNYKYFLANTKLSQYDGISDNKLTHVEKLPKDPFFFWYMVFCHELAHGFVSAHDSNHEYFLSSYAEKYMPKLITMLHNK